MAERESAINGVGHNVTVRKASPFRSAAGQSDIVTANIIADVIIDLSGTAGDYLKKDGILIVSGIIRDRKQEVIEAYDEKGFELIKADEMGEWVAMVFKWQSFS